jgi:hypothetical protein
MENSKYASATLTTVATAWLAPKTRKAAGEYILAKAQVSKRKRWANAAKAVKAGDELRMAAYAATGDEAKAKWADVRKADAPAKPKAAAKPKAKPAPKRTAKPKASDTPDINALVDMVSGFDEVAMAAFTQALLAAKRG